MRNDGIKRILPGLALLLGICACAGSPLYAMTTARVPAGDIITRGSVERSGTRITTDTTLFEGDTIRTLKASDGIIRIGRGRIELTESSELEIIRQNPPKIILKSGGISFNFPKGTSFEIITPQLEIRPGPSDTNLSGTATAQPQKEDRILSRAGNYTVLERQSSGKANRIEAQQILVASLVMPMLPAAVSTAAAAPAPQGPIAGPQIAIIDLLEGDVRVGRAATREVHTRITATGFGLGNGDLVRTLNGRAHVLFNDQSTLTLEQGTTVIVQEQPSQGGILRTIQQTIGNMWFNIQRVTGTRTNLTTPTAVAAIRGTEGLQEVPNDTQSTHSLQQGIEDITEVVTGQTVTIRDGQRVTAIRGVGFTPVVALLAALAQPTIGGGGGGAGGGAPGGGVAGGGGAAAAGGGAAASAAGAATASTVSTVATVASVSITSATAVLGATATILNNDQPKASNSQPLNPPGGQ
jgi:hypothetical protein